MAEKKKVEKKKKQNKKVEPKIHSAAYRILHNPVITEKTAHQEADGVYTFKVDKSANKVTVRRAIQDVYGVNPKDVRIINVLGKNSRSGHKKKKKSQYKKAIISLNKGDSIQIFEGV